MLTGIETWSGYINIKVHFRAKNIPRNKEHYFKMIKEAIYQGDITILNAYALNNRATKYLK